jgi:hypothetical protein
MHLLILMYLLMPSDLGLLNLASLLIEVHVSLVAELSDDGYLLSCIASPLPVCDLIMNGENLHE